MNMHMYIHLARIDSTGNWIFLSITLRIVGDPYHTPTKFGVVIITVRPLVSDGVGWSLSLSSMAMMSKRIRNRFRKIPRNFVPYVISQSHIMIAFAFHIFPFANGGTPFELGRWADGPPFFGQSFSCGSNYKNAKKKARVRIHIFMLSHDRLIDSVHSVILLL